VKKLLSLGLIGLLLTLTVPAYAQWGGGNTFGQTVTCKGVSDRPDLWFAVANTQNTSSALELAGYNAVRADYDVTGSDVSINVNFMCSNDSLWYSGDSIEVTADSWDTFDLVGGKDYNFYVESVSASDTISIYVTGYNRN